MQGRQRAMDQVAQVQPIQTGPASVVKSHVPKSLEENLYGVALKGEEEKGAPCGNPLFLVNECPLELVSLSHGSGTPMAID